MTGPSGFTPDAAGFPALAFDARGTPHVAFADAAAGSGASLMRFGADAGAWAYVGPPGFSGGAPGAWGQPGPSALRAGWAAHACPAAAPAHRCCLLPHPCPTSRAGPAAWTELAFDGADRAHVAYSDGAARGAVAVQRFSSYGAP